MFDLKSPCKTCPFRKGNGPKFQLSERRIREIAEATAFQCHNTVDYSAETREGRSGDKPQQCAGLMAILHREKQPNAIMQVGQRLGSFNPGELDPRAECYESLQIAIQEHERK